MKCEKCGSELTGDQKRWCSSRCSKLGLKSLYKKRNREKLNAYNRSIRKLGIRSKLKIPKNKLICLKCEITENVEQHHVKSRILGGKNEFNIILLCHKHHYEFENLTREFWQPEKKKIRIENKPLMIVETI